MENIYLVGFMGTGKSTVAKELSKLLPLNIVEMDACLETLAGMPISKIFEEQGEEAFRKMETMFLQAISQEKNQIISCGGGVVLKDENIDIMKKTGTVVLLKARPDTIYLRVYEDENRPLLKDKKSVADIEAMLKSREGQYNKAKDIELEVDDLTPAEISAKLIEEIALLDRLH